MLGVCLEDVSVEQTGPRERLGTVATRVYLLVQVLLLACACVYVYLYLFHFMICMCMCFFFCVCVCVYVCVCVCVQAPRCFFMCLYRATE